MLYVICYMLYVICYMLYVICYIYKQFILNFNLDCLYQVLPVHRYTSQNQWANSLLMSNNKLVDVVNQTKLQVFSFFLFLFL